MQLSQEIQTLFRQAHFTGSLELPQALDFGGLPDLYGASAYTSERPTGAMLMTDDAEQKLDAPKIQPPSDAVARPSVIRTKEDEAIWDEMQKPHKLGKHESATHIGLSPEVIAEMQKKGQASKLEFFDSTAEGALAALQKPPTEQVLIASNIAPNVPNLEQMQQYEDVQSDIEQPKLPKVAQTFDYDGRPPTLLPGPEMGTALEATAKVTGLVLDAAGQQAVLQAERQWNPYRGEITARLNEIPGSAWHQAYEAFPQFQKAGLSEQQVTELMRAIIRNELYNYDKPDQIDDDQARKDGKPMDLPKRPANDATLGYSQLSVNAVMKRGAEYPEQFSSFKGHEVRALLEPQNAPILVAATLVHNLEMYQRHKIPITQSTLAYSYNPPEGRILPDSNYLNTEHVRNVTRQLAIIKGEVEPNLGER